LGWRLACLILLGFAAVWVLRDAVYFHPDPSITDEPQLLGDIVRALNTGWIPWAFAQGCVTKNLQIVGCRIFGPSLGLLHLLTGLVMVAENLLLFRWIRRRHGEDAAWMGVLFNVLSASAFLRAHAFVAYFSIPLEVLAVLTLGEAGEAPGAAFIAGLWLGLGMAGYDAWLFAGPAAVAYLLFSGRGKGLCWGALGLGFLGGALLVLIPSREVLAGWWAVRKGGLAAPAQISSPLFWGGLKNLGRLWFGSEQAIPFMVVRSHPWLAPWAWPFLGLGLWAAWGRDRALFAFLGLALLPLVFPTELPEPNRAAGALPGLALAAGLGYEWLRNRFKRKALAEGLALALVFGGAFIEIRAFQRHQSWADGIHYSENRALRGFVESNREALTDGSLVLCTRLSPLGPVARFLIWPASAETSRSGARVLVVLPRELLRDLSGEGGSVHALRASAEQAWPLELYEPNAASGGRYLELERRFRALEDALPEGREAQMRQWADALQDPWKDPLWRSSLWKRYTSLATAGAGFTRQDAVRMLADPFQDGWPLLSTAQALWNSGRDYWLAWWLLRIYFDRQPDIPPPAAEALVLARPPQGLPYWAPPKEFRPLHPEFP